MSKARYFKKEKRKTNFTEKVKIERVLISKSKKIEGIKKKKKLYLKIVFTFLILLNIGYPKSRVRKRDFLEIKINKYRAKILNLRTNIMKTKLANELNANVE